MGKPLGARKNANFKAVSTAPSFNKTPMGSSTPPVPYPVYHDLSNSVNTVDDVYFNGDPVYVLNQTTQTKCKGDDPGTAKGVKSGTVNGEIKPVTASSSVNVGKRPLVREGDKCTLNSGNCPGVYVTESAPSPPAAKQGEKTSSPDIHDALDALGFVPGFGAIPDLINAGLYAFQGNYAMAGLSVVAAVPGYGDAVKGGAIIFKGGKRVLKSAEKEAVRAAEQKLLKEAEEKALKEADEKAEKEAGEKAAKKGPGDGTRIKKGPCDHLKKGSGKGDYRGGAHGGTGKPANDKLDSHHLPAKKVSPLNKDDGPAIQMDPPDHRETMSNGNQGLEGAEYRESIKEMIDNGRWRDAMAKEIRDIRRIAKEKGNLRKYNEAIREMMKYFHCLVKHGLIKGGLKGK